MALERQLVPISLAQGLDTKTDPKQVVPGKLLILENGSFESPKKIQKNPGFIALGQTITGTANTISTGNTLDSYLNELVMTDGNNLYSRSVSNDTWTSKGAITNLSLETAPIIRNEYQQTSQDSCFHPNGLKCFVWEDSSGGARYTITNFETGQQYVSNGLLSSTGSLPKCYALGNYIIILMFDTSVNQIQYAYLSVVNPVASPSFSSLTGDSANPAVYDATVINQRLFVSYATGVGTISTIYLDANRIKSSPNTVAGTAQAVSIFQDSSYNVWVIWYNGADVKVVVWDYALSFTPLLATTTVETVANVYNLTGYHNGTAGVIYYSITGSPNYNYFIKSNTVTLGGVVGTASIFVRSVCLWSKAFLYNSKGYIVVTYDSDIQPTYFVLDNTGLVVARFASANAGGIPAKKLVSNVTSIESGIYQFSFLQRDFVNSNGGNVYFFKGVMSLVIDFTQTETQAIQLASVLHITGGYLWMYDGVSPVEHGFHLFPEKPSVVTSGAGGSIAAGTYQYVVLATWVDNQGNIHRSAPSIPASITTVGATSSNTITAPTIRITAKKAPRSPISLELYRTEANQDIFYRVSSITTLTYNTTTADTVVFTDTLADSSIIGNQQLYTTGGEVENTCAPVPLSISTYRNRLMVVDAENPRNLWYSKQVIPGTPVEFNDSFLFTVEEKGGNLSACFAMDDKFITFKESNIYYMVGEGPAPTGVNNDFTVPQLVTTDIGCINKNSIVQMPNGLMFKSKKGIYILDRTMQANYIGYDVESFNSQDITSAQLLQDKNQVKFTLDGGNCLTYDYLVQQWSTSPLIDAVDSTIFMGAYTYLQGDGLVLQEDSSVFTSNNQFVPLKLRTSWLNIGAIQGFQRARSFEILGEYKSPHQLKVEVAYDYNEYATQTEFVSTTLLQTTDYGDDSPYGQGSPYGGNVPLYQFRIRLNQQKFEAIQITIQDTQSENFGEGYSISALTFEVGIKRGPFKLGATKIYG